ncbi:unnamed protein product [Symbiodinium pilosum]|uniref:Uncharacterized protein n=1 Tax=Symbiodinium pilosum TaxID=2952 RepID=A0A812WWM6_SYMPI|nr:unnamed protein product [Symbiodinium pilosum]
MYALANSRADALAQRSPGSSLSSYHYSMQERNVQFSRVPVPEGNTGVIICHQYIGLPPHMGEEVVRYDDYIRNQEWTRLT